MRLHSLIYALKDSLHQEFTLLEQMTREAYTEPAKGYFSSSVGMHIRHNLDHFASFFQGLALGKVDYESRERRKDLESDPTAAMVSLQQYIEALDAIGSDKESDLHVRREDGADVGPDSWLRSSIGRELQFLLGHTVHHNALIAMIADRNGIQLPEGFGVAPSTQRYQAHASA